MLRAGSIDGYAILAGLVVVGALVFLGYSFLQPLVVSIYRRYPGLLFPRGSLRVAVLEEERQENGWRWLLSHLFQTRRSVLTYWSFIWVIPLGFLLVISLAYLSPTILARVRPALVQHGWQAQLTITSLSFIVLIFLLEQISRTNHREGVIQEFFASSRIMPIIYFTLSTSGLIAYLYFVQTPTDVPPLVVNTTFFTVLGTIGGIGYVYYRVARLIFFDPLDELLIEQIQQGVELQLREENRQSLAEQILEQRLPSFVELGINRDGRLFLAEELGLAGYITDIDLRTLIKALEGFDAQFEGDENPTLLLQVGLGLEMQPGRDILSVDEPTRNSVEIPQQLAMEVAEAIYCSRKQPWQTGDQLVDRNLSRIGTNTRDAINSLNPSRLEEYLGFYTELLEHLSEVNRATAGDDDGTPSPVSDLVGHIYREFYPILEAAAQTGRTDLITTVRGELYWLAIAHHRRGEGNLFKKSVGLYASYYSVLVAIPGVNADLIHSLLNSLSHVQTHLTAELDRARTVDEAEYIVTNLERFYDVLEDILRIAVENDDEQTFNNVWNLGADEFVMVRTDRELFGLQRQLEQADNKEEHEQLERKLTVTQQQQEAVESFQNEFEETRFVAAAWAYREVREGNLEQEVFQTMFSESIKGFSFITLTEIYLRIRDSPRLDLFRWETEDADVFKGARMSMPATQTWVKEFFCAMGILLLDADQYNLDDLDERNNPIADIEVDRQNFPDLTETIRAVSKVDLAKTGVAETELDNISETKAVFIALHQQMETLLERREEDRVIDADLDPDKLSNFQESYVSKFVDQFVLRTVFKDLGWFTDRPYSAGVDVDPSGFNTFYPKGAFLPDPPVEYVHSLDREAGNHTDFLLRTWLEDEQTHLAEEQIDAYNALPSYLEEICTEQANAGQPPQAIIVSGFRATNILTNSDYFDGNHQPVEDVLGGFAFNDDMVLVYEESAGDFDAFVLWGSDQPAELTEYQRDNAPVSVSVEQVTRSFLEEEDPDGFAELTEEEIREKRQQVWLQVQYYAQFEASEDFGTILTVNDQS